MSMLSFRVEGHNPRTGEQGECQRPQLVSSPYLHSHKGGGGVKYPSKASPLIRDLNSIKDVDREV